MFCHKCDTSIPEGSIFCHKCGTKVLNDESNLNQTKSESVPSRNDSQCKSKHDELVSTSLSKPETSHQNKNDKKQSKNEPSEYGLHIKPYYQKQFDLI